MTKAPSAVWRFTVVPLVLLGMCGLSWKALAQEPAASSSSEAAASSAPSSSASTAATSPSSPAAAPAKPVRPGLQPYDVAVFVTFQDDPSFTTKLRQEIADRAREELAARAGSFWSPLEVRVSGPRSQIAPLTDGREGIERLIPALRELPHDKVFLMGISAEGGEAVVRGAEWDKNSGTLGSWISERVTDRRLLASTAARIVGRTFRPLATIESIEGRTAILELRGAELTPPDRRFLPASEGDSLQPFLRFLNRKREVERIQTVPWTYLEVQEVDRARVVCRVISSFKAPLAVASRRVQLMAVGATPVYDETRLEIAPHGQPDNPVVGARVEILDRLPTKDDAVEDRVIAATDRFGRIAVPVDPLKPLVWVQVYSGKSLLARVPIVPGLVPTMSLSVPDDSPRLRVEGELSLLEGELIDIVGRREVLMARGRQIVKDNKWDEIEKITTGLEDLPGIADFEKRVEAARIVGIQAARDRKDKIAEARVDRLAATFLGLVREHLDPEKIATFKDEMAELRRAQ